MKTEQMICRIGVFVIAMTFVCGGGVAQTNKLFELMPGSKTGISFKNVITESATHNALTYENLYNGGGVAVGDINNDGLDDIYMVGNMEPNVLYLNHGNFKFRDITASAGVAGREGWKTGVSMVDINGDGLLDIYVCYSGKENASSRRNQFFINKGNLTFTDRAAEMGLDDPSYSTQAIFFDYDLDKDLDLFLLTTNVKVIRDLEFEQARKSRHPYAGDKLFRNDNNHFTEVTEQAGVLSNELGFGLGVAVADINKDGWPDIYVSNDYAEPDYLYINNGNGTFTDRLAESVAHISQFSMGSDISDFNNDAWPDIFTADMLPEDNRRQKLLYGPDNYEQDALMVAKGFYHQTMRNMLHVNNGNGTFSEIGQLAGVSSTDWSWAPLFADYDNDGWKDLLVTNGYFRDYTNRDFLKFKGDYYFQKIINHERPDTFDLVSSMTSTPLHNYLFRNNHNLTFEDKSLAWGFEKKGFSNGAAYSDLDNDGDLDLIINQQNERAAIYRNRARDNDHAAHYLKIKLRGRGLNTSGFGAKVYVYAAGNVQYLEHMPVRGYQSCVSSTLHVGLGSLLSVDSIRVEWLSGATNILYQVTGDQTLEIGEGSAISSTARKQTLHPAPVFVKSESPIRYTHKEYPTNDFKRQPMLTSMLSTCGPTMASGDVNADGLVDIFIGGSKEHAGQLFLQTPGGAFVPSVDFNFQEDLFCTDADALFFDADRDGDLDLYIVSGGYHDYRINDKPLQDRLFLNDGTGKFIKTILNLPFMRASKSRVCAADFDADGDMDLFVGGRVVPGAYPSPPESYLLLNDGKAHFTNAISMIGPSLATSGMITDASWCDLNSDTFPDLVIAGEWMPIRVFINSEGKRLTEQTDQFFEQPYAGLWNRFVLEDFDGDGDRDLIAGNLGLNSRFRASTTEPLEIVYQDFDQNGSVDPILTHYVQGKSYPFPSRDDLLDQIYPMRRKFTSYESYANATLTDIFSSEEIKNAGKLRATELQTCFFRFENKKFIRQTLPVEAQYAPVHVIEVCDFNGDGNLDFVLAGNQHATRVRLGAIDANYGQLFEGDGKGNFRYVQQPVSGLNLRGDVRSMMIIRSDKYQYLIAGINDGEVIAYKIQAR